MYINVSKFDSSMLTISAFNRSNGYHRYIILWTIYYGDESLNRHVFVLSWSSYQRRRQRTYIHTYFRWIVGIYVYTIYIIYLLNMTNLVGVWILSTLYYNNNLWYTLCLTYRTHCYSIYVDVYIYILNVYVCKFIYI